MSIFTDADVTSLVRSLIGEISPNYWTNEEIALYIKSAILIILSKYWYLLAPTEVQVSVASLVANQEYVAIPTNCAKVLRVEVADDRKMLRKVEPDELWRYSVYDDGATATNYLNIWYLEYYDTTTDFPEALRPLIACEAALLALTKDEDTGHIRALYSKYEDAAIVFLSTDSMYEPTMMGDYAMDRSFTDDNPCAWGFRDGKIYLYKGYSED